MQYSNNPIYFPEGAIKCAKLVREYDAARKPFPLGAVEAARVLREFSARRDKAIESKVA